MGWSTNQKAAAKREKEQQKKKQEEKERTEQAEQKKWRDEDTEKKMDSVKQREDRKEKELARKRELRQLVEEEELQMAKINKKKEPFAQRKLTQAEIAANMAVKEPKMRQESAMMLENPNRPLEGYEVANNVEQALQALNFGQEKHPQKRFKAAFQAFCAKREPAIKFDYPKLKRSQRMELLHKEFEKSPENPFNQKVIAYNQKPRSDSEEEGIE